MDTPTTALLLGELRAERARQRVTLAMLAEATDISVSGLSRRLDGQTPITLGEADALARALGCDLLTLMQRVRQGAGDAA